MKLKHLDKWTDRRIEVAARYNTGLKDVCVVPATMDGVRHVFHLYVIQVNNRDEVMQALNDAGSHCGIHYPVPLPVTPAYAEDGAVEKYPVSCEIADKIVSLPMHGDLSDEQVDHVVATVRDSAG